MRRAVAALAAEAAGPRVATPAYLDRIAACAAELSAALDIFAALTRAASARQGGACRRGLAGDGGRCPHRRPREPGDALTAAGGAVDALVGDVLAGYAAELE